METLIYKGGDAAFKQIDSGDEYIFVSIWGVVDILLRSDNGKKVIFLIFSLHFCLFFDIYFLSAAPKKLIFPKLKKEKKNK